MIIYHNIAVETAEKYDQPQKNIESILKEGLKSKKLLIEEGVYEHMTAERIFTDEYDNIYFFAHNENAFYDDEHIPVLTIGIHVDPLKTKVYNSSLRGMVELFAYEASSMLLKDYNDIVPHFDNKKCLHPITARSFVEDHSFGFNLNHCYGPEIIFQTDRIDPRYFAYIHYPNGTIVRNDDAPIFQANQGTSREIQRSSLVEDSYTPSRTHFEEDYGRVSLNIGDDPLSPGYSCPSNDQDILSFEPIIGDNRDNLLDVTQRLFTLVIGYEGADAFQVMPTPGMHLILDFTPAEGDQLLLSSQIFPDFAAFSEAIFYRNGTAILPLSEIGVLVMPHLKDYELSERDVQFVDELL